MGVFKEHGTNLDDVFEPYQSGTKAAATGYRLNGQDASDRYAPIDQGAAIDHDTNCRAGGVDFRHIFAGKGTVQYALPIDGNTYSASGNRTSASLAFIMASDGTYTVNKTVHGTVTTLVTGTWLPAGDSVSSYSCQFSDTLSSANTGDGSTSKSNGATSVSALTTSRTFSASAGAITVGSTASMGGGVTLKLYKSGVLRSTTGINFSLDVTGN